MYQFNFNRLVLIVCIYLFVQLNIANAKITVIGDNNTETSYPTSDYFLDRVPYYRYDGIAVAGRFENEASYGACIVKPFRTFSPNIQKQAKIASAYPDSALILNYYSMKKANCETKEQAVRAINNMTQQLSHAGFPPIRLLILLDYIDLHGLWDAEMVSYIKDQVFVDPVRPPSMTVTTINSDNSEIIKNLLLNNQSAIYYVAEQEPGEWNDLFLSSGFIAYKWLYFSLLLIAFSYACARTLMLIKLKKLYSDLLLLSFIITIVYCILFSMHLISMTEVFSNQSAIYSTLSKLPFELILWHWSIVGRNMFSKKSILFLRIMIILDLAMQIALFICRLTSYDTSYLWSASKVDFVYVLLYMIHLAYFMDVLIFGGFTIWFGRSAHKLKKHPEGYFRFIQVNNS
ncbi:hypothetical protein BDF19DRAFT_430548 [Syncephalis fuscata]|nr:hypothetical protein BDF19DRAFT_430548 [Syncephalis fuscata]